MAFPFLAAALVGSAGATIFGAKNASDASKEAAKIQAQGVQAAADRRARGIAEATEIAAPAQERAGRRRGAAAREAADIRAGGITAAAERFRGATEEAGGITTDFFNQAIGFLEPTIEAGDLARGDLTAALGLQGREAEEAFVGRFETAPGFEASLEAGIEAIDRSASARGRLGAGVTEEDLFQLGQRALLQQFSERLDRLSALSSVGTQAASQAAGITTGAGTTLADLTLQAGRAEAQGLIGSTEARATGREAAVAAESLGDLAAAETRARGVAGTSEVRARGLSDVADVRAAGEINQANVVTGAANNLATILAFAAGRGGGTTPTRPTTTRPTAPTLSSVALPQPAFAF